MKPTVWSILLLIPVGAHAADVYRSVDANGVVTYSDLPTEQSERVTIVASRAGAPSASRTQAGREQTDSAADSPLTAEIPREPTSDELAADRERNCTYAREKLATYTQSHRLFRNGPDGERVYLSDAELSAARMKAESDVAEWCN